MITVVNKLKNKLKINGKIIIYVPSMEDEMTKLKNQNNKYDENDRDNHLFAWNFQLLSNLLIKCNYNKYLKVFKYIKFLNI